MNALEGFALEVLEILERDEDWSPDTTDAIAKAAFDRALACDDENSHFKRTKAGWSTDIPNDEEQRRAELLVSVLKLRKRKAEYDSTPNYQLAGGYLSKTALGVFRVVRNIVEGKVS